MKVWLSVAIALALLARIPAARSQTADGGTSARGGALTVRFLDVGQGDAALLTTSDRHAMLVDAGPAEASARIASVLASIEGDTLDAVVLTHAHADHLGALDALARSIPLERWIDAGYAAHAVPAYPRALAALDARHVPHVVGRRGDRLALGAFVGVTVLEPRTPLLDRTRSDLNANSVVLRIVHRGRGGDVRLLFEGDAEHPTEHRMLADERADADDDLRAEVLKVAHHGSRHASSNAMLDAVTPRLAVVSCGLGNDYGHPHAETLARLAAHHATIARTDREGDVTVTSDDQGLHWALAREATAAELMTPGVERREAP